MQGKSIDQVTDMMVANASNLIITIKPANQGNTLHNRMAARQQLHRSAGNGSTSFDDGHAPEGQAGGFVQDKYHQRAPLDDQSFDSDEDEIVDYTNANSYSSQYNQHHH